MTNQFFTYIRKEPLAIQIEGEEQKFKEYKDCFALDKVIRAISLEDGTVLVLLNDIHIRQQEVPVKNKQGKITAYKHENRTVQSEIYLSSEEGDRFYKSINDL